MEPIPLHLSDITDLCKKFSQLSLKSKKFLEILLEEGVESIKTGKITYAEVYELKQFLIEIKDNPLFGDASEQADLILNEIQYFYQPPIILSQAWN